MRIDRLTLRDFRSHAALDIRLGPGVNVIWGHNGAGKTNLLEALYFGCTGRSCRTTNEREVVRFGAQLTRVEVTTQGEHGSHELSVGFAPGEAKRLHVNGALVERLVDQASRPLISVFLPDRLELVKGGPALRRAHLDQFVAALWPARAAARREYAATLAQRNALLARIAAGRARRDGLEAWTSELAIRGHALMRGRDAAVEELAPAHCQLAGELGLTGDVRLAYRPRSRADSADALRAELIERSEADIARGYTGHGPHRDELALLRDGHELRAYGSQGEQRLGLLALLLAERVLLARIRATPPILLLDDVMSELDAHRRQRLMALLDDGGQSVITTTELAHVPGCERADVRRIAINGGGALGEALVA